MNRKLQFALFMLTVALPAIAFGQLQTASATAPATTTTAAPTGNPSGKIGVIDIQTAILATNEGQKEFTALQTKFQPKKTELESSSKEIENLQKQLDTQGNVLTEDARGNLVNRARGRGGVQQG